MTRPLPPIYIPSRNMLRSTQTPKKRLVHFWQDLLEAKPEGEQRLLALLVNKLGDPEKKISGKVRVCPFFFPFFSQHQYSLQDFFS